MPRKFTAALVTAALAALACTAVATAPAAGATTSASGDVLVVRVGDGASTLSSAAAPVFLDEYAPDGTFVRSEALPTSVSGADRRLTMAGSSSAEGQLQLSADGRFVTLAGYDADPGTASVAGTSGSAVNRVIARVDADGGIDTSTALATAFSGSNVRGAATDDGSRYWAVGSSGGVQFVPAGGSTTTQISSTPANLRAVTVAGGDLLVSTGSTPTGVYRIAGLPTTGGQTATNVAAATSPYSVVALDRDPSVPGVDTLYVADDSTGGGILKFSSDGTTWTARGTFRPAGTGVRGLSGAVDGSGVTLYATTAVSGANQLVRVQDAAAFDAPIAATASALATSAANTAFRGVAFAPSSGQVTAPHITTQPQSTSVASGQTATLGVAASGSAPLAYQWYQGQSGDTSTAVGTDAPSFTTPALTSDTSYWVRVSNAAGSADSTTATVTVGPPPCEGAVTPIGSVQGSGETSPDVGQTVTVRGVVVGDYEGASPALGGFYLQDAGDGDDATSDGIWVFDRGATVPSISNGQLVEVTGKVSEYQGQTELDTVSSAAVCGTGDITPTDVTLPLSSPTELERYEGMLVRFHQTLTVTENYQLGRFGEVVVSAGRLHQPTAVAAPGAPANAVAAANLLDQVKIDDELQNQNPDPIRFGRDGQPLSATNTLRGGDTITDATGVLTYTWAGNSASPNAYRLRPIDALHGSAQFAATNPRPAGPPDVGGSLKVGGANLLNYFNQFTGCTYGVGGAPTDCRGAENSTEFERQAAKEVAALTKLDVDVLAVMEMENNGYGPDSAIQDLVNRLNAATAPGRWAFVNPDAATGITNAAGDDAIKAAVLYRTDRVTPTSKTFVDQNAVWERRPIAQQFRTSTGLVTVVADHFKSKGSCPASGADADQGDGQGCWNAHRTDQANELLSFVNDTVVPGAGDPDVLLLGDFNSYAQEDPVQALRAAGYTDLAGHFHGTDAYSYVFDAQVGYLDYAFASPSLLAQVTGADDFHINADEPSVLDYNTNFKDANQLTSLYAPDEFRTSDHDSVRVGLDPTDSSAPAVTPTVTGPLGENGWYTGDVSVSWDVSDPESDVVTSGCDPSSVTADTTGVTFTCTAVSSGGTTSQSVTIRRDATAPAITWIGGPADGAHYPYGSVPDAPTCTAQDATSGPGDCSVGGYSTAVGEHTLGATAYDQAGNMTTGTRSYTVDPAPAPTVTALNPRQGPIAGGQTVVVTGTGFDGVTGVSFGATPATDWTVDSPTQITVRTPAHGVGPVDVTVTTPSGTSAIAAGDVYKYYALPVVTRVKPSTGPTGGYTAVTISGRNFAAYSTVRFGSNGPKCLSTKVVSSTTITCLTPPHVVGTVHVHVITPGGTSVSGTTDRFTYK